MIIEKKTIGVEESKKPVGKLGMHQEVNENLEKALSSMYILIKNYPELASSLYAKDKQQTFSLYQGMKNYALIYCMLLCYTEYIKQNLGGKIK